MESHVLLKPVWADSVIAYASSREILQKCLDDLQTFFVPTFPTRYSFDLGKNEICLYIKRGLSEECKAILAKREYLKLNARKDSTAEKKEIMRLANNIDRRVRNIWAHLGHDLYGKPDDLFQKLDGNKEVSCCVCMKSNKNFTDCEHNICLSCFATIVFKNSGNFVCPICRECKSIVENTEDEKVYFYESEVSYVILCIYAIMFFL